MCKSRACLTPPPTVRSTLAVLRNRLPETSIVPTLSRQIHLVKRPQGPASTSDFELVEVTTPDPEPGEVQIQTLLMSVDPYMRPRLSADQPLNGPLLGGGIGRVVKSRNGKFKEGDLARHHAGFQERFNIESSRLAALRRDPELPLSVYLHALGATGMTAYGGLLEIGRLREGEQVFVSTAAGAVGSVAAQIARIKGCYVVGATGAEDKRRWLLDEAGLDAAINYRVQPIGEALAAATPNGVDVYFENVGGDHLDAALARMNLRGRIPVCGMISTYNGEAEPVRALPAMIYGRLTMQGFVGDDFPHLAAAFAADMTAWLKDGAVRYQETILQGLERTADGLIGLFNGLNRGKMLIHVAD
jgi:NADPH-dependent curcumin reductase CurA